MNIHLVMANQCPTCLAVMEVAVNATGHHGPRPGDRAGCMTCGELLVYLPDGVRQATAAERQAIPVEYQESFLGTLTKVRRRWLADRN